MIEEWRKVVGWDGYEVSNSGQVRSVDRTVTRADGTKQTVRGSLLTRSLNSSGYWRVRLSNDALGRRSMARVHRLVAQAFLPNPNNLPEVNHIDCDRTNASVENLEWVTASQNRSHGVAFGAVVVPHRHGSDANCAKLTEDAVRQARIDLANGSSIKGLARKHGVHPKTMRRALRGISWAHVPLPAPPVQAGER